MANTKQPVDLLIAKGKKNLTKNEIKMRREQEVKAKSDNIKPPAYLRSISLSLEKKFDELATQLVGLKIMSNLDCDALARYIAAEYQYQKTVKKAGKMSPINPMYYDMVAIQGKLFNMARAAASDLGLTISSRCKLVVPEKEKKPDNKFNKFAK